MKNTVSMMHKALGWWFLLEDHERKQAHKDSKFNNSFTFLENDPDSICDVFTVLTKPLFKNLQPLYKVSFEEFRMIWRRGCNTADPQKLSAAAYGVADMLDKQIAESFTVGIEAK